MRRVFINDRAAGIQMHIALTKRMVSMRMPAAVAASVGLGACGSIVARTDRCQPLVAAMQMQQRCYRPHGGNVAPAGPPMPPPPPPFMGGAQPDPYFYGAPQQPPMGMHPQMMMPPPPSPYMQAPPMPMPMMGQPQMMAGGAAQPELGSKERPIVVVPAATKTSWGSRIWFLLFVMIGLSATMSLIEQYEYRTGGGSEGMGGGVRAEGGGRMGGMFGVSEVKPVDLTKQEVSFSDVRGCDEAKEELQEIVQFLKDPKRFVELGGRLPKGALLVGPPGTGKTMLAKAIAKEAGVKFFYASGSEFDEMFVGVGSRRVRELFAAAKANSPALIFIDEIDSLGGKRSASDRSHSRMTLNQLLAEMDGFQSSDEVIVIAATNTPDTLDKALTRPGRFDTTISVDPPDLRGRAQILDGYMDKIKHDQSFTSMDVARATSGMTGAELSHLINVAAIRAAILKKSAVTNDEIEYAKDRVMMGAENRSKVIPEEEKKVTAWHEGGHALVALLLEKEGTDPVHKATIVPRGSGVMGLVQQQPRDDRYSMSKKQMNNRLKVCLAGRVAEELILGTEDVTTGASSDFQQASKMARAMVRRFGFGEGLSVVDYESAETMEGAYMSDQTKQQIETEVKKLISAAHDDARKMLTDNYGKLEEIANQLLIHETLTGDELRIIAAGEKLTKAPPAPRPPKDDSDNKPKNPPRGGNWHVIDVVSKETSKQKTDDKSGDADSVDAVKRSA